MKTTKRARVVRAVVLTLGLTLGLAVGGATAATAADGDEATTPALSVSASSAAPGDIVSVDVLDWPADGEVTVQLATVPMCDGDCALKDDDVIEQHHFDVGGMLTTQFFLPADLTAGEYYISAFGPPLSGHLEATLTVTAPAPAPQLTLDVPATGAGGSIVVTGTDYPFDEMWLVLTTVTGDPWRELGRVDVVDGAFQQTVEIPNDVEPGAYEIWAVNGAAVPDVAVVTILPSTGGPDPDPSAEVGSAAAAQGGTLAVTGGGFLPGEDVRIELHSTPVVLTTVAAGTDGTVSANVTIPADAELRGHEIVLIGEESARTARVALTVTAGEDGTDSPQPLASTPEKIAETGADIGAVLVPTSGAAAAIVAGALALIWRRRMAATE